MTLQNKAEPYEVIEVTKTHVVCDGGDGAAGHPRVFLKINIFVGT